MDTVLLTGGLGFIGGGVLKRLVDKEVTVYVLARPGREMTNEYVHKCIRPIHVDLARCDDLRKKIDRINFDAIFHIGALRGGRRFDRDTYRKVNIDATETLAKIALDKNAKMVFCSSVGIFGAIPRRLPAREDCERKTDNFYHYTKIEAERILATLKSKGLRYIVIRPAITYGAGDFGFLFGLMRLIDKGLLMLSPPPVHIHLADLRVLARAFEEAAVKRLPNGSAYVIADKAPVEIKTLAEYIGKALGKKRGFHVLPSMFFRTGEAVAERFFKNDLWKARFQLLSKSWYYDVSRAEKELELQLSDTFEGIKGAIAWYSTIR